MAEIVDALMNRSIPDEDELRLLQCNGDIPDWLRRAYWQFKSIHDRCTRGRIGDEEIKLVVTMARLISNQPPHDDPARPFDLKPLIGGEVVYGTHLRVWWRDSEYKAMFIEEKRNSGGAVVLINFKPGKKGKIVKAPEEHFVPYSSVLGLWKEAEQPVEA